MKNHLVQLLSMFVMAGFCSVALAQIINMEVQLRLDDNQSRLDVKTRGQCSNDNHNGCIVVPHKKQARVNFSFVGSKQCNRAGGVGWNIDEVYLGGKGSPDKPSVWGKLDPQVQADFNVADAATGRLNKEPGSNAQSIVILDNNYSKYDIWYKVTAVCVNASGSTVATIETDPRIVNGGTQ